MLTKILQKFAIDLLKVSQIKEVQTGQQLTLFNRLCLGEYQPALLSAGTLNMKMFHMAMPSALASLLKQLQPFRGTFLYYFRYSAAPTALQAGTVGS